MQAFCQDLVPIVARTSSSLGQGRSNLEEHIGDESIILTLQALAHYFWELYILLP